MSDGAVFLDRDGVIVELVWDAVDESFEGPNVKEDVRLVPGAADAIRRIRSLDYRTVVVSNQPGAAKGKASHDDLLEAHEHVVRLLAEQGVAIDDYRYCLHHPDAVDPALARCVRLPEAEAGDAAGGCRRSRHRPLAVAG